MSVNEKQVLAALRQIQHPAVVQQRETQAQWRRANARIAAAMHASLTQQRSPRA
jgi:hypothetical protein